MNKFLTIIATIALTYFILVTSFYIPYHSNIYEKHFDNAYEVLGEEKTNNIFKDLKEYLDEDYFGYERTHLLSEFTIKEQNHMKDVKRIIDWLELLYITAAVLFIILLFFIIKNKKQLTKVTKAAGYASLIVIILIGLSSIINFSFAFEIFHKIFFSNGKLAISSRFIVNNFISSRIIQRIFINLFLNCSNNKHTLYKL